MKVRTGFVSNSSSSSYVIIGGNLDYNNDLLEYFNIPDEENEEQQSQSGRYDSMELVTKKLQDFYEPLGMTVECSSESEYFLIGLDLTDRRNHDKTINQMLKETEAIFRSIPDQIKPSSVSLDCGVIYT